MIKNLIFDIGGVITKDIESKAFDYLTPEEQDKLDKIVFYDKRIYEVLVGDLTCEEYRKSLIEENSKYKKEINDLLDKDKQDIFIPKDIEMVNLLYKLKKDYKIYFLSNMIDITYYYLKDFLADFDGGLYSFMEHTRKPDKEFYLRLINKYNLNVEETIFFDDKLRNILAGQELGIKGVKFENIQNVLDVI